MTFATTVNLVTIILCVAVLVQSTRMMRSLAVFRATDLPGTARALELATSGATDVLNELRVALSQNAEPTLRNLADAQAIGDELGVMIGIANATADRLLDTARHGREATALPVQDLAA
jgi:hypothetical protein